MARKNENTGFVCANCGTKIYALTNGSYRNHCPYCLHSLHVDGAPGDRASLCHGLMAPVGVKYHSKKGWQILHQCQTCGHCSVNKVASDTVQPDDMQQVARLSVQY